MSRSIGIGISMLLLAACGAEDQLNPYLFAAKGEEAWATTHPVAVIKGHFALTAGDYASSPDGDSILFRPDNQRLMPGTRHTNGFFPLRLEAIDALELHYKGTKQNIELATAARDSFLQAVGFKLDKINYAPDFPTVIQSYDDELPRGFIVARQADKYNRTLAFVFPGEPAKDGSKERAFDVARIMTSSVNAQLLGKGLVYPSFYNDLPASLRDELLALTTAAKTRRMGVWSRDRSTDGEVLSGLTSLENKVILPTLFRRMVAFFREEGHSDLSALPGWLKGSRRDKLVHTLNQITKTLLSELIDVEPAFDDKHLVRLLLPPELMVFEEL